MENDDIVKHLLRHEIPHDFRIIRNMVATLGLVEPQRTPHYNRVMSSVRFTTQSSSATTTAAPASIPPVENHETEENTNENGTTRMNTHHNSNNTTDGHDNNSSNNGNQSLTTHRPSQTNTATTHQPRSVAFKDPLHQHGDGNKVSAQQHLPGSIHYNLIPFLALPCQLEMHAVDDARVSQVHFQTLLAHIISDDAFLHSCLANGSLDDEERQVYKLYDETCKATENSIQMAFIKTCWLQNPPTQSSEDNSLVLIGFQCTLPNDRSELLKGVHMRLLRQLGLAGKFPHSNCVPESADALVKAIGKNLKSDSSGGHGSGGHGVGSHFRLSGLMHSTSAKSLLEKYKHDGCVLFIAEADQVSACTPLVIELEMRGIETFICSLKQFANTAATAHTKLSVTVDGKLTYALPTVRDVACKAVELVVFADPYTGLHADDPREWYDIRAIIEKSHAVKCPSIRYLIASSTRVLANLQKGNNMKQFLKSADLSAAVLQKLVEMVPLDAEEIGENYVQRPYHPSPTMLQNSNLADTPPTSPTKSSSSNNANGADDASAAAAAAAAEAAEMLHRSLDLDPSNATFIEKLDPIVESNIMVLPNQLRAGQVVPVVSMYGALSTRKTHVVLNEVYDDVEVFAESAPCKLINMGLYECIDPPFVASAVYNLHHATDKDTFGH